MELTRITQLDIDSAREEVERIRKAIIQVRARHRRKRMCIAVIFVSVLTFYLVYQRYLWSQGGNKVPVVVHNNNRPSQFEQYLEQYRCSPFIPPRSSDGVGTIVRFNSKGEESIIQTAEACLPPEEVKPEREIIGLSSAEYDLTADDKVPDVRKNAFRLIEPYQIRITVGETRSYLKKLPRNSDCFKDAVNPKNIIIHTVFGAQEKMFCYRAWKYLEDISGAVDSRPVLLELTPQDIEKRRQEAMH